jgi:pimeloyl-ACP methyl ester carboxylesterase
MKQPRLLHYSDTGSGPVVVLLHGYLASSRYWERVVTTLSKKHRVIAFDLLGFGKSPKPACSRYDYTAQLDSIEASLQQLGVTGKIKLVGHSMGSLIALRYAAEYPARVKKLVLTNMPVYLREGEARREILSSSLIYRFGLRRGLHGFIWPLFVLTTRLRLLPTKVAEGAVERRNYLFQNTGLSRLRSMRNVIFAATIEADLLRIKVKATLVSGLEDRKQYLRNIPQLRKVSDIVSHAVKGGHHLPLTHPELFADFI